MLGVWLCSAICCEYVVGIVGDGSCVWCPVGECAFGIG